MTLLTQARHLGWCLTHGKCPPRVSHDLMALPLARTTQATQPAPTAWNDLPFLGSVPANVK